MAYDQGEPSSALSALLFDLRKLEDADLDCVEFPRFKIKDDATALLVQCKRDS